MKVEIYTKVGDCAFCTRAKMLLTQKMNLDYQEFPVVMEDPEERKALTEKFNLPSDKVTVPQIVIDGNHIGGYDNLYEWYKERQDQF